MLGIGDTMRLDLAGLGIIMYSPSSVAHIAPGQDYLTQHFWDERDVQRHVQKGELSGFGTGTPGTFFLKMLPGYPDEDHIEAAQYKCRIAIRVEDSKVCVRDLYALMDWDPECPEDQTLRLADGIYHVTVVGDGAASGILGDNQEIEIYFAPLEEWPRLAKEGIPTLA
jgi:hypothetical protein